MTKINAEVEVVYRRQKGRTRHVFISAEIEGKSGSLTLKPDPDGSTVLRADTSEGAGTAYIVLDVTAGVALGQALADRYGVKWGDGS